jgi:hypothetical protein
LSLVLDLSRAGCCANRTVIVVQASQPTLHKLMVEYNTRDWCHSQAASTGVNGCEVADVGYCLSDGGCLGRSAWTHSDTHSLGAIKKNLSSDSICPGIVATTDSLPKFGTGVGH